MLKTLRLLTSLTVCPRRVSCPSPPLLSQMQSPSKKHISQKQYRSCFRILSVSYPNRTSVQLSTHADMVIPAQRMDSNKAGMEWREDLVNNNGVPIKVATKNLARKKANDNT